MAITIIFTTSPGIMVVQISVHERQYINLQETYSFYLFLFKQTISINHYIITEADDRLIGHVTETQLMFFFKSEIQHNIFS